MGVPRLTRLLQPYADVKSLQGKSVVLDGPAFCYHIHHICLGTRKSARNPLEAAISYEELGTVAIAWLDRLQAAGVVVRQIYFDGYLPLSKYDTRIQRVIGNTKKLVKYHSIFPITPCSSPSLHQEHIPQLFTYSSAKDTLMQLPPAPFLVPAILERLQSSGNYAAITMVVPAEADVYCADAIKQDGGIVITSDSDLLVYDIGPQGRVTFLSDIDTKGKDMSLRAPIYHPRAIALRLGLPELKPLAFEMHLDNHYSLAELIERARVRKGIKAQPEQWELFQAAYICKRGLPNLSDCDLQISIALQRLDPRISEFVLQFPFIAKVAGQSPFDQRYVSRHVFLPFLHDCPARTNAWEISRHVRQLAFGLINFVAPGDERLLSVFEHNRHETKSDGRELQIPDSAQLLEACESLANVFHSMEEKLSFPSNADLWTAIAVYQDIQWSHENSKTSLGQLVKQQVLQLEDKPRKNLSWDILQFYAQIQGSYYSFRILKQTMAILISCTSDSILPTPILQLHERLMSLPPLSEIKDLSYAIQTIKMINNKNIPPVAHAILGIDMINLPVDQKTSHRDAKKKRKEERKQFELAKHKKLSSNPYDILSEE